MDQPERNEHRGPEVRPGAALLCAIEAHKGNTVVQFSPLKVILPLVAAWVRSVERRLASLENSHT